jgi:tetratricopeptide (TPR) repeat protein
MPTNWALYASTQAKLGKPAEAALAYREALRLDSNQGNWWIGMAVALEKSNARADAGAAYQRALQTRLSGELREFAERHGSPSHYRPDRPAARLERHVIDAQTDISSTGFAAMDAACRAVLQFGRSAQCRLQAGAGGHQSVPGGFNNLNPDFMPLAVQAAQVGVEKMCGDARRFLIIPENHTRNLFYLQNVAALADIIRKTGLTVRSAA